MFGSPAVLCDPVKKYFSRPSLVIYFFLTPALKLKTGTAKRWETTNGNPPEPIKLSSQPTAGVRLCCAFTSLRILSKTAGPKPFC